MHGVTVARVYMLLFLCTFSVVFCAGNGGVSIAYQQVQQGCRCNSRGLCGVPGNSAEHATVYVDSGEKQLNLVTTATREYRLPYKQAPCGQPGGFDAQMVRRTTKPLIRSNFTPCSSLDNT